MLIKLLYPSPRRSPDHALAEPLQRTCLRKAQGDESPMNLGGLEPRLRPNEEVTEDVTLRILGKLERSKS
jgi:hypothetical protein